MGDTWHWIVAVPAVLLLLWAFGKFETKFSRWQAKRWMAKLLAEIERQRASGELQKEAAAREARQPYEVRLNDLGFEVILRPQPKKRFFAKDPTDDFVVKPRWQGFDSLPIKIAWADVQQVMVYKLDCFTFDIIAVSFLLADEKSVEIKEDTAGFTKLLESAPKFLPGCRSFSDWYMQPEWQAFDQTPRPIFTRVPMPTDAADSHL